MHFLVYRYGEFGGQNVVLGVWIVVWIESEQVLCALIDQIGMDRAKPAVRPRITEVKGKLPCLCLYLQSIRPGGREIDAGPCLGAKDAQRHSFQTDQEDRKSTRLN